MLALVYCLIASLMIGLRKILFWKEYFVTVAAFYARLQRKSNIKLGLWHTFVEFVFKQIMH